MTDLTFDTLRQANITRQREWPGYEQTDTTFKALEVCGMYERRLEMTGRSTGTDCNEYGDYVMETVEDPTLMSRRQDYVESQ